MVILKKKAIKRMVFLSGKSVNDFSKEVGISQAYMSNLINGHNSPSPKLALKIANALNVETSEIIEFNE